MSEAKREHAAAQWSARVEKELEEEVSLFVPERLPLHVSAFVAGWLAPQS
jgi:hypothetical protein